MWPCACMTIITALLHIVVNDMEVWQLDQESINLVGRDELGAPYNKMGGCTFILS